MILMVVCHYIVLLMIE